VGGERKYFVNKIMGWVATVLPNALGKHCNPMRLVKYRAFDVGVFL
jgi:hypothetical protein